jgi:hypothetical protein
VVCWSEFALISWRSGERIHRSVLGLRSQTLRRSSPHSRLELHARPAAAFPSLQAIMVFIMGNFAGASLTHSGLRRST